MASFGKRRDMIGQGERSDRLRTEGGSGHPRTRTKEKYTPGRFRHDAIVLARTRQDDSG
jgi:hypothetical protein